MLYRVWVGIGDDDIEQMHSCVESNLALVTYTYTHNVCVCLANNALRGCDSL